MQVLKDKGAVHDHLANERTYLAGIRTSRGVMVFGLVFVNFTLLIKRIPTLLSTGETIQMRGHTSLFGILILLVGTITASLSYICFKHPKKQLKEGQYVHSSGLITIPNGFILSVRFLSYCKPYSKYLI